MRKEDTRFVILQTALTDRCVKICDLYGTHPNRCVTAVYSYFLVDIPLTSV